MKIQEGVEVKIEKFLNGIYNPENEQVNHNYKVDLWGTLVIY